MTDGKPFPLNAWYAAAWGHEIKHELAARTVCGMPFHHLSIDAGALWARRMIDRMLAAERGGPAAVPSQAAE